MKEYRMSFSKAGCFTTQVTRLPLANLVGNSLYWLIIVAVSFGKEVVVDSISPRSPSQLICATGFPVAAIQMAATVSFPPSIKESGPFIKLTVGSTVQIKKITCQLRIYLYPSKPHLDIFHKFRSNCTYSIDTHFYGKR